MNKTELISYIKIDNVGGNKTKEKNFQTNLPIIYNEINNFNEINHLGNDFAWKQKLINYLYDIEAIPTCSNVGCNNSVNFYFNENRYFDCCSNKCQSIYNKNKREDTNRLKFGFSNPMQNSEIAKKSKDLFKKEWIDNGENALALSRKKENTSLKHFNTSHPMKSIAVQNKSFETNLSKFGYKTSLLNENVKQKTRESLNLLYGVDNPMKSQEIKNKVNESNIKICGSIRYVLSDEYKSKKIDENKVITAEIYSKKLNILPSDLIILDKENLQIKNYCAKHLTFDISKNNLNNRLLYGVDNICTECYPIDKHSSIKEIEIKSFIDDTLRLISEKIRIENKEIDVYIPSHSLGIEFNGLYWHSNIYKDKNYHINKSNDCEAQGIQLLHVFEDEWLNKKEIVKSIIKAKLGIIENKIFARKTIVKEISTRECSNFLESNHIQGNVGAKIKIGLFYGSELVSVMTFGKKRLALGNKTNVEGEYEMLRFCNKLNTSIIGGASKLLSYFRKIYNPKSILTFADRRYSNGNLYKELGFKFTGNTEPNYYYFKCSDLIRHNRFNFRKDILVKQGFDASKTEFQIMNERGYLRVFDCGHMKFMLCE